MKKFLAILVSALMVIMMALPVTASTPFSDVPDYHWALDAVNLLAALGIVEGYPDGTFQGKNQATRYEVAIMIAQALEYLDRDIRSLAETVGELDAKVSGTQAPDSSASPADGVVLQPVASPDATILEQVIAEKIAGMSEAQWEQFDDRLSALLARVDDLTEANKAEHAQLWAAIEAVRAANEAHFASCTTPVGAEVQQSVATLPGCEKLVADAVAESNAAWQAAVANLEGQIKLLAADHDNFDARLEALRRALYEEAQAAEEQNQEISLELARKLEALTISTTGATPVESAPDYEAAINTLLAVHAAEERAAREAALAELDSKIELALLQQKAEVMMAFYDSIIASNVDRDILLANLRADLEKAIADREAAIIAAIDARHDDMLVKAIDDSSMAIINAARESLNAYRDEVDRKFEAYAAGVDARFAQIEAEAAQSSAETNARFGNVYNQMADSALVVDGKLNDIDMRLVNSTSQLNARYNELQARFDQALAEQKAELIAQFNAANAATADELNQKLVAALRAQSNEILEMHTASVNEMKAAYDARLDDMEATWEVALLQQKAELMMSFYDSIAAERDARERALQAFAEKHDLDLAQLRAELQVSFLDSIAAERDAWQRALEALAEQHDLDLLQLKAEMQMGFYDSMIALREDLEARIDLVVASIAALKDEYQKELNALSARVSNLEAQLAVVEAKADQNARDIAAIRTEEIAPITQRVRKLERDTEIAQADIATNKTSIGNLWTELNRVKLTGSNEVRFEDINAMSQISGAPVSDLYKNPFNRVADPDDDDLYIPSSIMQNELKLTLNIQPDPGVTVTAQIGLLSDVFGVADTSSVLPKLDLDMSIVTPNSVTTILAGELARPAGLTKYQASAKVWNSKAIEGIALTHDAGKLDLSGFVAKVGHGSNDASTYEYMHIAGAAGTLQLTEAITVGARAMVKVHDEPSQDTSGDDPDESLIGADVSLKLSDTWSARGELSAFDSKLLSTEPTEFVYARDLSIGGKLGVVNIAASHVQVDEGYAPSYRGTSSSDPDRVSPDTRVSKLTLVTDSIGGFVVNGLVQRKGDADFASKDVATVGGGVKYNAQLLGIGLTLRADATYNYDAFIVDWENEGVAKLGFDLKYMPVSAGFTWKNHFEDSWEPAMSYIGYVKLDAPIGGDTLKLRGGWEQSFGAETWQIWGAGLNMAMPLIEDRLTLTAEAGYDVTHDVPTSHASYDEEFNDLTRLALAGGLTFNLSPDTTLSGTASYESRAYETPTAVHPSGEYLQFGAALNHKFYKNTSLTLKYDIKNVLYAAGGPDDYGVRVAGLSLKTTF